MEPSCLPPELFNQVISYHTDRETHFRTLCSYSLVSNRWYSRVSSHIYSRWLYDGEVHSILSLWKFLRTILCNKKIAQQVHEVNIRDWTFGLVHTHGRLVLSEGDLDLVREAVHTAGLEQIENNIMEGLRKADPRSLMALLLASLPNMTTLYAQLPKTDTLLAEVLRKAAATQYDKSNSYPLRSLRKAHFTSAWNYRDEENDDDEDDDSDDECVDRDAYHLKLDYLWPIFHLPTVQMLSLFDFDTLGAADLFSNSPNTSNITDLTLVHRRSSELKSPDFLALLALPRALISLSIYLEDSRDWELHFEGYKQLSNLDLWQGICRHKDTLEHLDVYRDCVVVQPPLHSAGNSHLGLMQGFRRLKHLHVQPEALLGGCCEENLAPFSLMDTLPVQLESLTFYGDEGLTRMRTLGQQLQDVISGSRFQKLSVITLEDTYKASDLYFRFHQPPHWEVYQACRKSGKQYQKRHPSFCIKGGAGRRYYRYVEQKRQRMIKKLKRVRFALTEYLERMENGISGDRADGHHLSSDDLDTYEPPWEELTLESLYGEVDVDGFFKFSGIDLDNVLGTDDDDWDYLTDQLDEFRKYQGEDDSLETYLEMEMDFDMDNASENSDGVW